MGKRRKPKKEIGSIRKGEYGELKNKKNKNK